jgi:glycosyltransferase involved in cell wall biosynthesis
MKVMLIVTNADESGAPKHVEAIARGLSPYLEFIVVLGERGPVARRISSHGIECCVIPQMRTEISPLKDFVAAYKLVRLIARHKPDLVHCHSTKAGMVGRIAAAVCGRKWLYSVHGWGWRGLSRWKAATVLLVERLLSKLPGGFYLFVANDVRRQAPFKVGLDDRRGVVVYNGVRRVTFGQKNDGGLSIVMPARVCGAKDHETLLKAFETLDDRSSRLVLCGRGTNSKEFQLLARRLAPKSSDRIALLGEVSNMDAIYQQCNVFVLSSHFEALPLSIIEAMSAGLAIIASSVGGVPELIDTGSSGTLVPPGSEKDLVEALRQYKNPLVRNRHASNAQRAYEERFSEQSMLNEILKIYQSR